MLPTGKGPVVLGLTEKYAFIESNPFEAMYFVGGFFILILIHYGYQNNFRQQIDLEIKFIESLDVAVDSNQLKILVHGSTIKSIPLGEICKNKPKTLLNMQKLQRKDSKSSAKTSNISSFSKDEEKTDSRKVQAQKLLIQDWSLPDNLKQPRKFDLQPSLKFDFKPGKCESNPSLDQFIKIPRFSLNRFDYNTSRKD